MNKLTFVRTSIDQRETVCRRAPEIGTKTDLPSRTTDRALKLTTCPTITYSTLKKRSGAKSAMPDVSVIQNTKTSHSTTARPRTYATGSASTIRSRATRSSNTNISNVSARRPRSHPLWLR
ncbi:hypothetical protein KCU88_g247, partial [Aureobasidium melanogenum]